MKATCEELSNLAWAITSKILSRKTKQHKTRNLTDLFIEIRRAKTLLARKKSFSQAANKQKQTAPETKMARRKVY